MGKYLLNWLTLTLLPPIGAWVIRFLGATVRIRMQGGEVVDELYRQGKHVIFSCWHGRQLMMPLAYRGTAVHVLISRHRDGELIRRIVARFGLHAVRGSTTRGGAAALRALIKLGRSGVDLGVTPDGPKGPRQVAQPGVIQLARATGLPIVPIAFGCSKKKSSRVGTASRCRIHSAGDCSSLGSRSGCRARRPTRTWNENGVSSKTPSIA